MKRKKLLQKLLYYYLEGNFIRVVRKVSKNKQLSISGVVMQINEKFLIIAEADDFSFDGFTVIPIKTIKKVKYGKTEQFYNEILNAENRIEKIKYPYKLNLSSWQKLLKSLAKLDFCIISECEQDDLNYFCIGHIKKAKKKSLHLQYINSKGIMDNYNTKHFYTEITKLNFNSNYANMLSKYVRVKAY